MKTKLLFVDDEPNIRLTLPTILEQEDFAVTVAASVPEAIDLINKQKFDVLISDLNIGQPSDGFTVVSVMRRVQPEAITFILTGYPDFESALRAIRNQVDDYLTKPTDIISLVANLKDKLANRRPFRYVPTRRVPELLLDKIDHILGRWLVAVSSFPEYRNISSKQQIDKVPDLLARICAQVLSGDDMLDDVTHRLASEHGSSRYEIHSRQELIVFETRLLQREIASILQENLLAIDLSTLIPDVVKIADFISEATEESIRAFNDRSLAA